MIYCIHHHDFWVRGGVESGQVYRAKIFRNIGENAKFIFATTFPGNNIQYELSNLGFLDLEIIWLYSFLLIIKLNLLPIRWNRWKILLMEILFDPGKIP